MTASVNWANSTAGGRSIYMKKGTLYYVAEGGATGWAAGDTTVQNAIFIQTLLTGDTLILATYQNSGGSLNVSNGFFSIEKF